MAASVDEMYTLTERGTPVPLIAYSFFLKFLSRARSKAVAWAGLFHLRKSRSWQRQSCGSQLRALAARVLGGEENVVGQTATLDGVVYTIIGVMPQGVTYPGTTELWTPLVVPAESAGAIGAIVS